MRLLYYALPRLRLGTDEYDQRRGTIAFWGLTIGMIVMTARCPQRRRSGCS